MNTGMFNDDQFDHMRTLEGIPREHRCPSGWHIRAEFAAEHPHHDVCDGRCRTPRREGTSDE